MCNNEYRRTKWDKFVSNCNTNVFVAMLLHQLSLAFSHSNTSSSPLFSSILAVWIWRTDGVMLSETGIFLNYTPLKTEHNLMECEEGKKIK